MYQMVHIPAGPASRHEGERLRDTWQPPARDHETTVPIHLQRKAAGTTVAFHQERLADAAERERMRLPWEAVGDALRGDLERSSP